MTIKSDNFNDNSFDTDLWTAYNFDDPAAYSTYAEQNQRLEISGSTGATADDLWETDIAHNYECYNKPFDVQIKIVSMYKSGGVGTNDEITGGLFATTSGNSYGIGVDEYNGNYYIYWRTPDYYSYDLTSLSLPYWVRMVFDGSVIYLLRSANGTDWILKKTEAATKDLSHILFAAWQMTYSNTNYTGYVYFDDFIYIPKLYYHKTHPANIGITSDNFNDNSFDTDLWSTGTTGAGIINEQNQQIEFSGLVNNDNAAIYQTTISGNFDISTKIVTTSGLPNTGICMNLSSFYIDCWVDQNGDLGGDGGDGNVYLVPAPSYPFWMRIKRIGTTGYAYYSTDNIDWNLLAAGSTVAGPQNIFIYFFNNSGNASHAYFDDFVNNESEYTSSCELPSVSGTWDDSLQLRHNGVTHYAQLESNLGSANISDLRVRKNGTTYGVMCEIS